MHSTGHLLVTQIGNIIRLSIHLLQGIRSLYKGMAFPFVAVGGINSLYFGVYGSVLRVLMRRGQSTDAGLGSLVVASGLAGVASGVPTTPVELVKIKLQIQPAAAQRLGIVPFSDVAHSSFALYYRLFSKVSLSRSNKFHNLHSYLSICIKPYNGIFRHVFACITYRNIILVT